jgi:hypothetical protein
MSGVCNDYIEVYELLRVNNAAIKHLAPSFTPLSEKFHTFLYKQKSFNLQVFLTPPIQKLTIHKPIPCLINENLNSEVLQLTVPNLPCYKRQIEGVRT